MEPVTALTDLGIDRTTALVMLAGTVLICWLALLVVLTLGAYASCYLLGRWQRWRKDRRAMATYRRQQRWWHPNFLI